MIPTKAILGHVLKFLTWVLPFVLFVGTLLVIVGLLLFLAKQLKKCSRGSEEVSWSEKALLREESWRQALAAKADCPPIFMVAATIPRSRAGWTLRPICVVVFVIQTLVMVWVGHIAQGKVSYLNSGFRSEMAAEKTRQRWMTHFFLDLTAFFLMVYVCWSNWCRLGTLRVYRFYWHEGGTKVSRAILFFAVIAKFTAIGGVIFVTYLLFRQYNVLDSMLFNVLVLEFITSLGEGATAVALGDADMRTLILEAQMSLEAVAKELVEDNVMAELCHLESANLMVVLGIVWKDRWSYGGAAFMELGWRVTVLFYKACCFTFCILTLTGGNIAHSHLRNVLWFLHIRENKSDAPETGKMLDFLLQGPLQNRDNATNLVAATMVFLVWVACFLAYKITKPFCCCVPSIGIRGDGKVSERRQKAKRVAGERRAATLKILKEAEGDWHSPTDKSLV